MGTHDRQRNFHVADLVRAGLANYADFSLAWPDEGEFVARAKVRGRFRYRTFPDMADDDLAAAMLAWCLECGVPPAHATSPRTS